MKTSKKRHFFDSAQKSEFMKISDRGAGKKGISNVVITILLILLGIVAVVLAWAVISGILKTSKPDISIVTSNVVLNNISIDDNNLAKLIIKREPGQGEVVGIKFAFYNGTDSYVYTDNNPIDELETKIFSIPLTNYIYNVSKIEIALILQTGEQKTISSVKTSASKQADGSWKIIGGGGGSSGSGGGGGGVTPCTPKTCAQLGKECESWSNGCGKTLNCGSCGAGEFCNNGLCEGSYVLKTCESLGYNCGTWSDGYDGSINCGSCSGSDVCVAGNCQASGELLFEDTFDTKVWTSGTWENAVDNTWSYNSYSGKSRYFKDLGTKIHAIGFGYTYLDTTTENCNTGKCLKGIAQVTNGGAYHYLSINGYVGNINANYNSESVIGKSLPQAQIDIYVKQISGCRLEVRPIGVAPEAIITEPMGGWQTFPITYTKAKGIYSQSKNYVNFLLMLYPPTGQSTLQNCYIEYYLDNYKIYGDSRNDHWISLTNQFANNPQGDRGEVTTTITSSGVSNDINIKVVPGEPEAFSVVIDESLGLSNVYPSISDLTGPGTNKILSSDIEVKWISKWKNFKFNNPALGGQDVIEVDDPVLQVINIPGSNSNKAWFSLSTPNVPAGTYTGTITISYNGGSIYTIPVSVEVLDFSLDDSPLVKAGIYVKGGYSGELGNKVYSWMEKAGIIEGTYPQSGYNNPTMQNFKDQLNLRRSYNIDKNNIFMIELLGVPLWRYVCFPGGDSDCRATSSYHNFKNMRSMFIQVFDNANNALQGDSATRYVYSADEAQGCDLTIQAPLWELGKDRGYKWFAAIHSSYYDTIIDPNKCDAGNTNNWDYWTAKYGNLVRDYIDMWIMTERNYILSKIMRSDGKISATYGYPFTDAHSGSSYHDPDTTDGYEAQREEFWRTYFAGADYYFNYAFDDINGKPFDNNRKMALIIPTPGNNQIVDGMSSEGFIRGSWDMRYLNTLIKLVEQKEQTNTGKPDVVAARDFIDIINTKTGWQQFKYDMINEIERLRAL